MSAKVAVVGSGPSGCYLAQSLRKLLPSSELTLIDRLPVPYGLVRYGVAPDHQGTKAVTKQFARLFERDDVAFVGNTHIGTDITLTELQEMFDIVVLATGLPADRSLGNAFEEVETVYGAGRITRLWNGHPDEAAFAPALGQTVAVIGAGNVAMDIVRLLAKGEEDLVGSDAGTGSDVHHIHLIARSPANQAKFDAAMVRELGKIAGLTVDVPDLPEAADNKTLIELAALSGKSGDGRKALSFHFATRPLQPVLRGGKLSAVACASAGSEHEIPCDSIITAIGFDASKPAWRDDILSSALSATNGHLSDGLFATGWFRRGPTGTIAENRADAKTVAGTIASTLEGKNATSRPGRVALLEKVGHVATDYADWQQIDEAERRAAPPNRVRAKATTTEQMLSLCSKGEQH